jgi:hypothetical protein
MVLIVPIEHRTQHGTKNLELHLSQSQWRRVKNASAGYFGHWFLSCGTIAEFTVCDRQYCIAYRCAYPGRN